MDYTLSKMITSVTRKRVFEQLSLLGDFKHEDQLEAKRILDCLTLTKSDADTLIARCKALYDGDIVACLRLAIVDL